MITNTIFKILKGLPWVQRKAGRIFRGLWNRQRLVIHHQQRLLINPVEHSGFYLYYEERYDYEVFSFLLNEVEKYQVGVDAGANIGVYTCFLAARISVVHAFEPMPIVFGHLEKNVKLNDFRNVWLHQACVSNSEGEVSFAVPSSANSGIGRICPDLAASKITVPCVTLDDLLSEHLNSSILIKMDIEGAEWMAIQGMKQFMQSRTGLLSMLIEVHPEEIESYGGSVSAFYDTLEAGGLHLYEFTESGLQKLNRTSTPRFCWATSEQQKQT